MMSESGWPYQQLLVVGLGRSGWSAVHFLVQQGVRVRVLDTRASPPYLQQAQALAQQSDLLSIEPLGAALPSQWQATDWPGVQAVLVSPGIDARQAFFVQANAAGVAVLGDVELAMQALPKLLWHPRPKIIAITGSNGKSTVTTWVAQVLQAMGVAVVAGGNLGTPVLTLLQAELAAPSSAMPRVWVLELSSFQLETLDSMRAEVAVCLNIVADHLDRYADLKTYAAVKRRIYRFAEQRVMPREDALACEHWPTPSSQVSKKSQALQKSPVWWFGQQCPAEPGPHDCYLQPVGDTQQVMLGQQSVFPVSELQVYGHHNQLNALAVLAILAAFGMDPQACRPHMAQFVGLPHRCQRIGAWRGITWFNDSKATNVGAARAGIMSLQAEKSAAGLGVLLGGQAKPHVDYRPLLACVAHSARWVVVFGAAALELQQQFEAYQTEQSELAPKLQVIACRNLAAAVATARQLAHPGDRVLLSPGCASFDEFDNYQARGHAFMQWVYEGEI